MRRQEERMEGVRETPVGLKHRLTPWSYGMGSPMVPRTSPAWPGATVRPGSIPALYTSGVWLSRGSLLGFSISCLCQLRARAEIALQFSREMSLCQLQKMLSLS